METLGYNYYAEQQAKRSIEIGVEIVTRLLNEARDENNPSRVLDCIAVLNVLTNLEAAS
jgi:hypothetical protein